jgi:isopentenyldiphosphate isomerase
MSTTEQWQLFDEQGRPIPGAGAAKNEVFGQGLLHAAAHVWIWRLANGQPEILLQKRAATKRTWPNRYDISAAGHIDLGEEPLAAALRETSEEIGLGLAETDLQLFSVQRAHLRAGPDAIENEFQWLYLLKLPDHSSFDLQAEEVAAMEWKSLHRFQQEVQADSDDYVPHSAHYFATVIAAIEAAATKQ